MAFRITTNGLFRSYGNSIRRSNLNVNEKMERVQTNRNFASYSENPTAAAKAFRLRRDYWRAGDYIETSGYLTSKFETAWTAAGAIVNGDDNHTSLDGLYSAMYGISDTAASGRRSLGIDLISKADSIALSMNARYNGEYVFAGSDGLNVPYTWDGDTLLYRGVDVSAAPGTDDYKALQTMDGEVNFVNVGLGLEEDENQRVIPNSAVNAAISGLNFLGYGTDEDGDPLNLAVILRQLGNIYRNCNSENGDYASPEDKETATRLLGKLQSAITRVQEQHVEISSRSSYVQTNMKQLQDSQFTLSEQIDELEHMDMAMAISEMMWAQYSYNAALRVGNDILSESLFDYMR